MSELLAVSLEMAVRVFEVVHPLLVQLLLELLLTTGLLLLLTLSQDYKKKKRKRKFVLANFFHLFFERFLTAIIPFLPNRNDEFCERDF